MRLRCCIFSLAIMFGTVTAHAVTVTNKDDQNRKLTVLEGDKKQDHVLAPNGVLDAICPSGCTIRLGESEDDEYILEGPEVVSIEDNKLYDDGPEGQPEAAPGSTSRPPPPTATPPAGPAK
jgi:hypothetical protein